MKQLHMYHKALNIVANHGFKILSFLLISFTLFVIVVFIRVGDEGWRPIKSNGMSYHAYLPAIFIYSELDMKNIV